MTATTLLGALTGLLAATGVIVVLRAITGSPVVARRRESRLAALLAGAGLSRFSPATLVAGSIGAAVTVSAIVLAATGLVVAAAMAGSTAAVMPTLIVRRRARTHATAARASWPEAVDSLAAGIRAGLSLPDAVSALATSGPAPLRAAFGAAALEYRATGSFESALDTLADEARDAVADRVVAALRLGREVGGTTIGDILRTLSTMLREDARLRAEIRGRQSWTVSAARMAVAAPWLTLVLLSTRPEAVTAYSTPAGAVVIVLAGVMSAVAYALMLRMSRLPDLPRLAS
jgi:tight adherence protein B